MLTSNTQKPARRARLTILCLAAVFGGALALGAASAKGTQPRADAANAAVVQPSAAFNLADYHQWRDAIPAQPAQEPTTIDAARYGAAPSLSRASGVRDALDNALDLSGFAADAINNGGGDAFSNFYRNAQLKLLRSLESGVSKHTEDALYANFSAIKKAGVQIQTGYGEQKTNAGIHLVGSLSDSESHAYGWQLRAYGGEEDAIGSNAGVFYRTINEGLLLGVNAFFDYENEDLGGFIRFGFGGEVSHSIGALNANYYLPITDEKRIRTTDDGENINAFSRQGYDVQLRINAPGYNALKVAADYYFFEGKGSTKDDDGFRYGAQLNLSPALRLGAFYDDGAEEFGGEIFYLHTIGESPRGYQRGGEFKPDLFAAVSREYTQRIATVTRGGTTPNPTDPNNPDPNNPDPNNPDPTEPTDPPEPPLPQGSPLVAHAFPAGGMPIYNAIGTTPVDMLTLNIPAAFNIVSEEVCFDPDNPLVPCDSSANPSAVLPDALRIPPQLVVIRSVPDAHNDTQTYLHVTPTFMVPGHAQSPSRPLRMFGGERFADYSTDRDGDSAPSILGYRRVSLFQTPLPFPPALPGQVTVSYRVSDANNFLRNGTMDERFVFALLGERESIDRPVRVTNIISYPAAITMNGMRVDITGYASVTVISGGVTTTIASVTTTVTASSNASVTTDFVSILAVTFTVTNTNPVVIPVTATAFALSTVDIVTVQAVRDLTIVAEGVPMQSGNTTPRYVSRISLNYGFGRRTFAPLGGANANLFALSATTGMLYARAALPDVAPTYPPTRTPVPVIIRANDESDATPEATLTVNITAVSPVSATAAMITPPVFVGRRDDGGERVSTVTLAYSADGIRACPSYLCEQSGEPVVNLDIIRTFPSTFTVSSTQRVDNLDPNNSAGPGVTANIAFTSTVTMGVAVVTLSTQLTIWQVATIFGLGGDGTPLTASADNGAGEAKGYQIGSRTAACAIEGNEADPIVVANVSTPGEHVCEIIVDDIAPTPGVTNPAQGVRVIPVPTTGHHTFRLTVTIP